MCRAMTEAIFYQYLRLTRLCVAFEMLYTHAVVKCKSHPKAGEYQTHGAISQANPVICYHQYTALVLLGISPTLSPTTPIYD
jgi:hypothetical protein